MDKNYGIVYAVFGEKAAADCIQCVASVRRYCDYPIKILSDHPFDIDATVEIIQPRNYEFRWGVRNSDYFRLIALRDSPWDVTLYLDNDYLVVNPRFLDGFEIAKNFGMAIPINSRVFQDVDLRIGKDVSDEDRKELSSCPASATGFDCAVIFYNRRSKDLLLAWIDEMEKRPCRGPIVLARAIWRTKQYPYALPFNWLVDKNLVGIDSPIILHVDHKEVRNYYQGHFPLFVWRVIWGIERLWEVQHKKYLKLRARFLRFIKRYLDRLSRHP